MRFWPREDREDLVGLLAAPGWRGGSPAQVRAAAGQARAELVEDDRQALAVGQAQRVVDQVEVDRLATSARPAAGTGPCPAPRSISRSGGGGCAPSGARLGRRALDELLADQRLRADRARRRRARKSSKPGLSMRSTTAALLVGRDVERLDLADLDAGDLHVLARDDRERRCRRSRARGRRRSSSPAPVPKHDQRRRRRRARRRWRARRFTGPGARGSGRSPGCRRVAERRRAVGAAPARRRPGSAGAGRVCRPVEALARRDRRERPARRVVGERVGVEDRLDRARSGRWRRSWRRPAPKSRSQPTRSGV